MIDDADVQVGNAYESIQARAYMERARTSQSTMFYLSIQALDVLSMTNYYIIIDDHMYWQTFDPPHRKTFVVNWST